MKCTSPILQNMSGKLGGAVAASARGGIQYFRALRIPTNPQTFLQSAIRGAAVSVSALWRDVLTDEQREAWWDAVEGSGTGKSFFTKVNQPRAYSNNSGRQVNNTGDEGIPISYKLTPPPGTAGVDFTHPTFTIDDSANNLTFPALNSSDGIWTGIDDDEDTCVLYVYGTHQQRSSRFSRQHPYQLLAAIELISLAQLTGDGGTFTIDLAALGLTTAAGEVMYLKTICQGNDGRLSAKFEQRVEITS